MTPFPLSSSPRQKKMSRRINYFFRRFHTRTGQSKLERHLRIGWLYSLLTGMAVILNNIVRGQIWPLTLQQLPNCHDLRAGELAVSGFDEPSLVGNFLHSWCGFCNTYKQA